MRSLAIILLLFLAVACGPDSGDGTEQAATALAVLATVAELAADLDDGGVAIEGTATVSTADATSAAVPETTSGDVVSGVIIDGFCPAEVEPRRVGTPDARDKWGNRWALHGRAYADRIVLEWGEPTVPGVRGYVVARTASVPNLGRVPFWRTLDASSVRTFTVNESSSEVQYIDTADIEPSTPYSYRVFPFFAPGQGLGFPTASLEIWSPPADRPAAPYSVGASRSGGNWDPRTDHSLMEDFPGGLGCENCTVIHANHAYEPPVYGMRVLRRESGENQWQLVRDAVTGLGSETPGIGWRAWWDEDVEPSVDYEYAICLMNSAGVGRATLLNVSGNAGSETVQLDPPRDIKVASTIPYSTVYWAPSSDPMVTGYHVERMKLADDDTRNLHFWRGDRADNYVTLRVDSIHVDFAEVSNQKFRVRTATADGHGPWSEWVGVDTSNGVDIQSETPQTEIDTLSARNDRVHLVWRTEGSLSGLKVRYLRRQADTDAEYMACGLRGWVSLNEFDWDYTCSEFAMGWTDEYSVRPDTEYEYAVQAKRGGVVGPVSDPVTVRTEVNPGPGVRRPLPVLDLEATPTSDGVLLTWELPDDPTLKGILVEGRSIHGSVFVGAPYTLPPDQTQYLASTRGYDPYATTECYEVQTFNEFGTQSVGYQDRCVDASEMLQCPSISEWVAHTGVGHHLSVHFRACEEASIQVIRRELTVNGFKESRIDEPCAWLPSEEVASYHGNRYFEGTVKCEYDDTGVKPGTWYVYELTQTFADGRVSTTHHEMVTRPRVDEP